MIKTTFKRALTTRPARLPQTTSRAAKSFAAAIVTAAAMALTSAPSLAAPQAAAQSVTEKPVYQLVIVEAPSCTVCGAIRTQVQPAYEATPNAALAPMVFLDIHDLDKKAIRLNRRLSLLPTALVVKDNLEIGRIEGYWGRDPFLLMVTRILHGAGALPKSANAAQ